MRVTDWIIAVATLLNASASIFLWLATNRYVSTTAKMFTAAQMPIVTVMRTDMTWMVPEENPVGINAMTSALVIANFGGGPAYELVSSAEITVNGAAMESRKIPDKPKLLPPHDSQIAATMDVPSSQYPEIQRGRSVMKVSLDVNYEDANGRRYHYHYAGQYKPVAVPGRPDTYGQWISLEETCKDEHNRNCAPQE